MHHWYHRVNVVLSDSLGGTHIGHASDIVTALVVTVRDSAALSRCSLLPGADAIFRMNVGRDVDALLYDSLNVSASIVDSLHLKIAMQPSRLFQHWLFMR